MPEPGKDDGSSGSGGQSTGVLDIDGNKFTAENVKELQQAATQAQQVAKVINDAAEKYQMDAGGYVDQAEGAFAVVGRLVQEGIINEQGELVTKKDPPKGGEEGDDLLDGLFKGPGKSGGSGSEDKTAEIIAKALGGFKEEVSGEIGKLKQENSHLFRIILEKDMKTDYPDLSAEEISQAIGKASYDPKKRGVKFHAEEIMKTKGSTISALEEKILEKYGINKDEWEEKNKMKQQGAEGGAAAFIKKKKLSFTKKGEGYIHPKDATKEFLNNMG